MLEKQLKVHLIAIGDDIMQDLAVELKKMGHTVSGSDESLDEQVKDKLTKAGLLPHNQGWALDQICKEIDAVIISPRVKKDNPELLKAQQLNLKIFSYPEFIYELSKDKQRIVIVGSHGKTMVSTMVIHVLQYFHRKFDYLVGEKVGNEGKLRLTEKAPIIIIEGDDLSSSEIDPTPKFIHYKHHIGLITGLAWDNMDVYPTFDEYVRQFENFADASPKGGSLIYCEHDDLVTVVGRKERDDVQRIEYKAHRSLIKNGKTYLSVEDQEIPLNIFGRHNMMDLNGAKAICLKIGITEKMFYEAICTYQGLSNRLEMLFSQKNTAIFKDLAHTPSMVRSACKAVREQFPERKVLAVLELQTYSSLNKEFLHQYKNSLEDVEKAFIFYKPEKVSKYGLSNLSVEELKKAFNKDNLDLFTVQEELVDKLQQTDLNDRNVLFMTTEILDEKQLRVFLSKISIEQN